LRSFLEGGDWFMRPAQNLVKPNPLGVALTTEVIDIPASWKCPFGAVGRPTGHNPDFRCGVKIGKTLIAESSRFLNQFHLPPVQPKN